MFYRAITAAMLGAFAATAHAGRPGAPVVEVSWR
jgi:hypothetical protein